MTRFVWFEIGKGRYDDKTGEFHGMPHRGILGMSMKYIRFVPIGKGPPLVEPGRPANADTDDEGDDIP